MLETNTSNIAKLFDTTCENIDFSGVSIDSRNCKNQLFIAIKGERFDGHNFTKDAEKNGAKAVVAHQKINTNLPVIYVANTTKALGIIANYHRKNINPKVIGITGSNGKTTTKNMLYNIFSQVAPTLATKGNLNNHIGVPLTLLDLEPQHKFAIIEMGANHLGEIKYLRDIAKPDVACVINTLDAHIGEFGGKANLIKAKSEIYHKDSINIINNKFLANFLEARLLKNIENLVYFGKHTAIDFNYLTNVKLQLLGKHNLENALAAVAIAKSLGVSDEIIKQGLENTKAEQGRLELIQTQNNTIINDCYNASPSSMKYALQTLNECSGTKVAVLGNMAELGDKSDEIHTKIGEYTKTLNIDYLFSIGNLAKNYGFIHFDNADNLIKKLSELSNTTMLFKASRIAKLETIIKHLT
jgi:UDP-N-acetylmuramoyl-tripeptide--D-alanyl-D-alanine ligase